MAVAMGQTRTAITRARRTPCSPRPRMPRDPHPRIPRRATLTAAVHAARP
jgi:hypothetical protein